MSLQGKKGLIVGIANEHSIAYGCAEVLRAAGAELAITDLNAEAEPHVRPLGETLGCPIVAIEEVGQLAAFLASDAAAALTGNVEYVDFGYHIMG